MNILYLRAAGFAVLLAVVIGVLGWIHHTGVQDGRAETMAKWDTAKRKQIEANLQLEYDTRVREQALQAATDTLRRTKDAQLNKISGDLRAALDANRVLRTPRPPEPAADTPAPTGAGPVCSGAGLFREDADFLVREAARADGLRVAYLQCEAQYNAAVKTVNGEQR